jgi:hypothetical protein
MPKILIRCFTIVVVAIVVVAVVAVAVVFAELIRQK